MTNKKNLKIADAISLLKEWEKYGIHKIPRPEYEKYNNIRKKLTDLSSPIVNRIIDIVKVLPESACPPGTTGYDIKEYILNRHANRSREYPLDDSLRYCFFEYGSTFVKDVARFQYACGDDGGLDVLAGVGIPLRWLEAKSEEELKCEVLKTIYKELCRDIYLRDRELEHRRKGKDQMYNILNEFLDESELKNLEVKEENK